MTHKHHRTRALRQKLLQPLDTLDIEMVRRLVEQQHIGFLEQYLRQFDTHTPASGEFRCRTLEVGTHKTQTSKRPLYLSLVVLCAHHNIALVLCGVFLYQRQITLALVVCTLCEFLVHPVQTLLHLRDIGKSLLGLLTYCGIVLEYHHLREISDTTVGRHADISFSSLLLTTEYLQHRGFSGSVFSYEGNTVSVVDNETRINEQRLDSELHFQSFYRYHRLSTNL